MEEQLLLLLGSGVDSAKAKQALKFASSLVKLRISQDIIPTILEDIVMDIALARYERFGSEGVSSESVDAVSQSYHDNYLLPYENILEEYVRQTQKQVKFY